MLPAMTLTTLLIILLVLALCAGPWGYSNYGWAGLSPVVFILVILLLFFLVHR